MALTPLKILDAATKTGIGKTWDVEKDYGDIGSKAIEKATFVVSVTGSPTVVLVELEGSIDNTNWHSISHHNITPDGLVAGHEMFHSVNRVFGYIRGNVKVLRGGTNPTVTVIMVGI